MYGYLIYGVDDKTHEIVGTTFQPRNEKGEENEDLIPWLTHLLTPRVNFEVHELVLGGKQVVIFEIHAIYAQPASFKKVNAIVFITNLGSILYALNLDRFPNFGRKMLRIILYLGLDRLHAKKEWILSEGYVISLQRAIAIIEDQLPSNEIIE